MNRANTSFPIAYEVPFSWGNLRVTPQASEAYELPYRGSFAGDRHKHMPISSIDVDCLLVGPTEIADRHKAEPYVLEDISNERIPLYGALDTRVDGRTVVVTHGLTASIIDYRKNEVAKLINRDYAAIDVGSAVETLGSLATIFAGTITERSQSRFLMRTASGVIDEAASMLRRERRYGLFTRNRSVHHSSLLAFKLASIISDDLHQYYGVQSASARVD